MNERVPTLSEVAAHAGVSLATASRALNGSARTVNPELRDRVLASAGALGYSANLQAQAVARGTSNVVALVVGDIADPYFAAIASGVVRVADERGLVVTISATGPYVGDASVERERSALTALRGQRPRAVVLASSRVVGAPTSDLPSRRVAVIGGGASEFATVDVDNRAGAAALATELQARGYRDFAIVAGPEELVTVRDRVEGFRSVASSSDVVHTEFSREGAERATAELLASDKRPECIFAVSDVMALGVMAALRKAGITPGTGIAVAGFDDIPLVADVTPALTSVALPLADIGAHALNLALSGHPEPSTPTVAAAQVRLRASTPAL